MKKNIAGFEKSKSINYSTSVTATTGEKIVIWLSSIIYIIMILASLFVLKNIVITFIIMFMGIFVMMGLMIFFIFRPLHKEEREMNERLVKASIDKSYNNITGKFKDNSQIEDLSERLRH